MVKRNAHIFAACCIILLFFSLWLLTLDRTQFYPFKTEQARNNFNTKVLEVATTRDLIRLFERNQYTPPFNPQNKIPKILVKSIPADIKQVKNIETKKSLFIRLMLPIIIEEQKRLRQQRVITQLLLTDKQSFSRPEIITWFKQTTEEYKINPDLSFEEKKIELLKRLDELPLTLILAQAAIESAWGTSRFAIEGNSLFGQWTFNPNNGITPKSRSKGATHKVKMFDSLQGSVRSYLENINKNNAYKELRETRATMRKNNENLNANKLAEGLIRYSQKGTEYVRIVKKLLRTEAFEALEKINQT